MSTRRHVLLSFLAAGAVAGLVLQRRCAAPVPVVTRQLWRDREAWAGRDVEVVGELKEFLPGTPKAHFAIEDDLYRVGVIGNARPDARTLLGRRVRARGVFVFTEKTGGCLESPSLVPVQEIEARASRRAASPASAGTAGASLKNSENTP